MPFRTATSTIAIRTVDLVVVATSIAVAWYFSGLTRLVGGSIITMLDPASWAGTWVSAWLLASTIAITTRAIQASRARRRGGAWAARLPSAHFGLMQLASSILVLVVGANFLITNAGDDAERQVAPLGLDDELGQLRQISVVLIIVAWTLLQTNYAERYARIWVRQDDVPTDDRCLVFPGTAHPTFSDFFYFAITVGVSFATPDVEIRSSRVRSKITFHVMLSFIYSTVILAALVGVITA